MDSSPDTKIKFVLICHKGAEISQSGVASWISSFADLAGIILIDEPSSRKKKRIRREIKRVGLLRFIDVLAFKIYYRLFLAARDAKLEAELVEQMRRSKPAAVPDPRVLVVTTPNGPEAREFLEEIKPDMVLARCKTLLKKEVFEIPRLGSYVLHPGICPEYRNAHGCFWALANRDLDKVGLTLLRIDAGVDTGPTYGYYSYEYDELNESHILIQHQVLTRNLHAIQSRFIEIAKGLATPIDTTGRPSGTWGQPWMSKYLYWKRQARKAVS